MMLHGAVMYAEAQHLTGICFREDADVSAFLIQISVLPAGKPTFCDTKSLFAREVWQTS